MEKGRDHSDRIESLQRQVRLLQIAVMISLIVPVSILLISMKAEQEVLEEVRAKKIVVVDEKGVARVVIAQDPTDTQRRSRAAGITLHDGTGAERGGMSTFDDGSVIFALDAPTGVGSPMRDRLGMGVWPDGSSHVMLIDNATKGVVKLYSDGNGKGGVQVFDWNDSAKVVRTKTITFKGEEIDTEKYGSW